MNNDSQLPPSVLGFLSRQNHCPRDSWRKEKREPSSHVWVKRRSLVVPKPLLQLSTTSVAGTVSFVAEHHVNSKSRSFLMRWQRGKSVKDIDPKTGSPMRCLSTRICSVFPNYIIKRKRCRAETTAFSFGSTIGKGEVLQSIGRNFVGTSCTELPRPTSQMVSVPASAKLLCLILVAIA